MPGLKVLDEDRVQIVKFLCSLCSLLLIQPVQTLCGHLFCSSCVENLLKKSPAHCPVDGSEVKKEEAFPDNFTRGEILDLNIHCPSGCKWVGTVKEYQEHFNVCGETILNCVHAQCDQKVKRSLLARHLKEDCLYRQVTCTHCKEEFAFNLLKDHKPDCSAFLVTCIHCKKPDIPRNDVKKHEMTECEEVEAECDFKSIGCDHAKDHCDRYCSAFPVTCKHCEKANIPRRNLKEHETMECEEFETSCDFKIIGCTHAEVGKRKDLRQHYSEGLIVHVRLLLNFVLEMFGKIDALIPKAKEVKTLTVLETRVRNLESTLSNMKKSLEKVETNNQKLENERWEQTLLIERLREELDQMALTTGQSAASCNGTLLWKIDGFNRRHIEAMNGVQTAMYSPPFYSGQYGYKMCARIHLNGDGFGKDTHISLFFVVMKGEYDALLPWPFQKNITMMLIDQNNENHMIHAFRSDPQSSSFQQPRFDMNIASGSPLFMPLDGSLYNHAYIKDDVMFIRIMVEN